jgi:type IV secretion system protein VirB1
LQGIAGDCRGLQGIAGDCRGNVPARLIPGPEYTRAIIQVESGGNPLAIGDNDLKKSFAPKTKGEAISLASSFIARGHSVDLGLMQINSLHLAPMRLSLDDVFDPCRNVNAGTTILSGFYHQNQTGDPDFTLFKALSAYNTGQAWKGAGYVNKILAAAGVKYRVLFVPVEGVATVAPDPVQKKKKTKFGSRSSPFFFGNTTTALVPRKGFR